ncbi:hypothetical protein HAX54_037278 [Datura stramonium]|uniref:FAS1 domain-containing protein n=1 Tax=Datura stramonium TaxID=4076 RepID=A0ABS8VI65_DATST|nr:hypothetical protein [Datura stramonium]
MRAEIFENEPTEGLVQDLGSVKDTSVLEIKKELKKVALQVHPDKNIDNRKDAENKLLEIAVTYEGRQHCDMGSGTGAGGFNPFCGGEEQFIFHFEGEFPGGDLADSIFTTIVFEFHVFLMALPRNFSHGPAPSPIPPPARATAPAPGPPGPTNVTKILEKAGQCSTFIRLLQTTQEISQITSLLNNSNSITLFVPPDNAFLSMKAGTLNSFNDQQKSELIKFHVLPQYFSLSQFQTASNPVQTQAGGTSNREFPINITTNGTSVNITTGIVNASITNTIYIDSQLAIYQLDKVLLPLQFFVPPAPTPAPAPPKTKKKDDSSDSDDSASSVSSGAINSPHGLLFFLAMLSFVYVS